MPILIKTFGSIGDKLKVNGRVLVRHVAVPKPKRKCREKEGYTLKKNKNYSWFVSGVGTGNNAPKRAVICNGVPYQSVSDCARAMGVGRAWITRLAKSGKVTDSINVKYARNAQK